MEHEALLRLEAIERATSAERAEEAAKSARASAEMLAESLRIQVRCFAFSTSRAEKWTDLLLLLLLWDSLHYLGVRRGLYACGYSTCVHHMYVSLREETTKNTWCSCACCTVVGGRVRVFSWTVKDGRPYFTCEFLGVLHRLG